MSTNIEELYDIVSSPCDTQPYLDDLVQTIPILAEFGSILTPNRFGFWGLDLAQHDARVILERFRMAGARGYIALSAYRQPKISFEQARQIAADSIFQRQVERDLLHLTFLPISGRERELWWWFTAPCKEWMDEGMAPGAIMASVDKIDGHIWNEADWERFAQECV